MIGRRHMNGENGRAARRPDDRPRRRPPVVRLVRLQRRLRGRPPVASPPAPSRSPTSRPPRPRSPGSSRATLHTRKVSVVGAACGAVAGLVAITPASGFVTPGGALVIGLVAGGLCYSATLLRARSRVDDALDVFAVHGVGGMFGALATGIFASSTVQAAYSGLLDGNPQQLVTQFAAVAATVAYAAVGTFVIVKLVDLVLGLRVKPEGRGGRSRPLRPRRGGLPGLTSELRSHTVPGALSLPAPGTFHVRRPARAQPNRNPTGPGPHVVPPRRSAHDRRSGTCSRPNCRPRGTPSRSPPRRRHRR